jgi:hypothetical protein
MNNNKYFITDADTMLNKKDQLTNSSSNSDSNSSSSSNSSDTSDSDKLYLEGCCLVPPKVS